MSYINFHILYPFLIYTQILIFSIPFSCNRII